MAISLAINHWRPYLLGKKFLVTINHKSLKQLLQQKVITRSQQNWMAKLLGYNFNIVYKLGSENKRADTLSRKIDEGELQVLAHFPMWLDSHTVLSEVHNDIKFKEVIDKINRGGEKETAGFEYR